MASISGNGESGYVNIPRWILILILGLLVNFLGIVYSAGSFSTRVTSLEQRFDRIENKIDNIVDQLIHK